VNLVDLQTSETIHLAVSSWQADARIADIEIITPDASSRRYYRVFFQDLVDKKIQSCVAMIFDSNVVPEAVGKDTMLADEAYVVL